MPQKGKHKPPHRREKKQRTAAATTSVQKTVKQPAAAAPRPAPDQTSGVTPVKVAKVAPAQTVASLTQSRYPYLASELKWIGIIFAFIFVLLIILAIFLPGRF